MEDFRSPSDDTYGKSVSELNKAPGQAIPLYAEVLESDPSPDMRRRAAIALGMTEDGRAVEPLIEALGDRDLGVVMMAVRYLGKIGDERAVEPLIRTLAVDNSGVRQWTANALESITGEDFDDDYSKWKAWYDKSN